MQRRNEGRRAATIWVERIVWNVLAATVLAGMIGVLLFSLRWLDEIDPEAARKSGAIQETLRANSDPENDKEPEKSKESRATRVARVNDSRG